jgi:PAS domain S-box-containing protein
MGVVGVNVDITERKKAEAHIDDLRALNEKILNHSSVGILTYKVTGQCVFANEKVASIVGTSVSELLAQNFHTLAAWKKSGLYDLVQQAISMQAPVTADIHHVSTFGKDVWVTVDCITFPSKGEDHVLVSFSDITERKQAEESLRKSEERFAKAFHASPNAIIISRLADGLIIEVNEGWSAIFGHKPNEVIGRTTPELGIYVNPEDRQKAIANLEENGFLRDFEVQMRLKSGEIRETSLSAERIELNGVPCLLAILRDITERKQAEQALRESERRLKRAQEIAHLGSWELDLIHNSLTWSDEVYRIFGLEPQQFAATYEAFLEAVHPDDRAAVDDAYAGSIEAGKDSYEIEHRVVSRTSGEVRIVHEKCEHFRDQSGKIIRSIGMVHDITERKQAEYALRESEERFRSLADSMPQLLWTALPDGTVDYYNQRYEEYQNIKQVGAKAWDWAPVLHPDDLQPTIRAWQHSLNTGETYQIEHRVRIADGSYCWHLSRGIPVYNENGDIIRWFGTATNIHDLKLAQEQLKDYAERLEHSNRELEQFAFMASHDLQEPLRKIEMFGDLLLERGISLNAQEREYLDRMRNAAGRMRDMVTGLLQLSRVTTQGRSFVSVDLSQVTADVLTDMEEKIRRTGAKVDYSILPVVEGDPVQLRQLMQNLIDNALKYHQPETPPHLRIHAKLLPEQAQILVEDKGIGFKQEDAERIFQPFQRLVGRSEYEGSGIGLAICRRIVERHAGKITVLSQPGHGTTFIITLPAAHPESARVDVRKDGNDETSSAASGR